MKINKLKVTYFISVLMTFFSAAHLAYSIYQGYLLDVVIITPFFAFFYPITLIGTVFYIGKKVLQKKSILDLISMAGGNNSSLGGFGGTFKDVDAEGEDEDE